MMAERTLGLEDEEAARLLALARVVIGGAFLLFPRRAARVWTGEADHSATARLAVRALGARDLALGLGAIMALEEGKPAAAWLQAGVVADLSDAASALTARDLSAFRRLITVMSAGAAVVLGWRLSQRLD
jgi:hypothetical protein